MTSRATIEGRLAAADPALGRVIDAVVARIGRQRIPPSRATPFEALVRAVVYQSVSGKAAASIFSRLKEIVGKPFTPSKIIAFRPQSLTRAGLSSAKARTIRSLAGWFAANPKLSKLLPTYEAARLQQRQIEATERSALVPSGSAMKTAQYYAMLYQQRLDQERKQMMSEIPNFATFQGS